MGRLTDRNHSSSVPLVLIALSLCSLLQPCSAAVNKPWFGKKGAAEAPPATTTQQPRPPSPGVGLGRGSSAIFPLVGNVYPDGLYYVALNIGNPPKPYFLDVDTGSDLTWLQCDAPCVRCSKGPHSLYKPSKNNLVSCQDPICTSLQATSTATHSPGCAHPSDQCDYEIEYADDGYSIGVLVSDTFSLRLINGSLLRPNLVFGCGYDQQGSSKDTSTPTDGVLGLGLGKSGILTQLRDQGLIQSVIGHCLGRKGRGFLFLGDAFVPRSGMTWTSMSTRGLRKNYAPGPAVLYYGKQPLITRDFQVVFDSGSSYTYFSEHPYELLLTSVMKDLSGKPLKPAPEDDTLPLCWKGNKPFRSVADVRKYFSSLILSFTTGKRAMLEIPPENYLITTKYGSACLGILNGTQAGLSDLNVIGDISFQDLLVVYDNEREQIGWARANCDRNIRS